MNQDKCKKLLISNKRKIYEYASQFEVFTKELVTKFICMDFSDTTKLEKSSNDDGDCIYTYNEEFSLCKTKKHEDYHLTWKTYKVDYQATGNNYLQYAFDFLEELYAQNCAINSYNEFIKIYEQHNAS